MKKIAFIASLCLFFACNNAQGNRDTSPLGNNISKNKEKNCLTKKDLFYQELLKLKDVAELISLPESDFKVKSTDRKDEYGDVYYSWKSDRPDLPNALSVHVMIPDNNFIGFSSLNAYDDDLTDIKVLETFEIGYKQLSEAELDAINKNAERHLEGKTAEEKEAVAGFLEVRKNFNYEKIENFATSTFWRFSEEKGGELIVLSGNEKFKISVKINHNADENLALAKQIAEKVLSLCK